MENENKLSIQKACLIFCGTIAIYFLLSIITSVILQSTLSEGEEISSLASKPWYVLLSYGIFPISFILTFLFFARKDKSLIESIIPEKSFKISYLPMVILLTFSILFGLSEINEYFIKFLTDKFGYEPTEVILPEKTVLGVTCAVLAVAVLPAVFEELMFRKLILSSMQNLPSWFTVLIGGLLFSLFHFNPAQTPYQFVFGCVFVMVVLVTKSVYYSMIMHFLNNLTILVVYYAGWSLNYPFIITIIALVLFVILVGFLIYKLVCNRQKSQPIKDGLCVLSPIILCFIIWLGGFL